jgi:hypothetical protein
MMVSDWHGISNKVIKIELNYESKPLQHVPSKAAIVMKAPRLEKITQVATVGCFLWHASKE